MGQINLGVSNVARNIKQPSIAVSSVARNVTNGYMGVGGVAREIYKKELVIFENGAFQNGFSIYSGSYGTGTNTSKISGETWYTPYNSSADGIACIAFPSGFSGAGYSKCCFDLYFGTVSNEGKVDHPDDTDYAWYAITVNMTGATGGYSYDILDDYYDDRLIIECPLKPSDKFNDKFYYYTRGLRNSTYAMTPATYVYRMWLE